MADSDNNYDFPATEDANANAEVDLPDDDYEEPITAKKVFETLQSTWLNERLSPEILPQQTDMLDLMLGQIAHMEENLKQLDKNDFRLIAHRMELDRIRYIISSYLRARLAKIEAFTAKILIDEEQRTDEQKRLSLEEHRFATEYAAHIKQYYHQIALRHMPINLQEDTAKEIVKPNTMTHVFLKSNVSINSVVIGANEEEVDLVAGSQHIMPYQMAADLVVDGRVQLI